MSRSAPPDAEDAAAFFRAAALYVCELAPAQPGPPPRSALLAFALAPDANDVAMAQALDFARHAIARHYAFVF